MQWIRLAGGIALAALLGANAALATSDHGQRVQDDLDGGSMREFGVGRPLAASSTAQITKAEADADPRRLATLAQGLRARVVTSGVAAPNIDMIALWPNDRRPTHLIFCNEEDTASPGLQRLELATGQVQTIVTGTSDCDPARRTPWGTILFGEEAGGGPTGGRLYELINPLATTGVTLDRLTGTFSGGVGAQNLTPRPALGRLSFEGQAVFPNGVVYFGDEQRPGTGTPGGAYFKFVPAHPRAIDAPPITSLDQSPLVAGSIYGLRVGLRSGATDYGQGTEFGFGKWVPIPAAPDADLRAQAVALKLTGYYRPEDLDIDLEALAAGNVRFCGNNTGNESDDHLWGEAICIADGTLAEALANTARPEIQPFVIGSPALAMPDNIAYQPGRGNWVIHEDADTTAGGPHNDDLWDCLPDGGDFDLLSDGCIRIGTLNDLTAEWTGGIFDATGTRFFVSVQHNVTGKGVILEIIGWNNDADGHHD